MDSPTTFLGGMLDALAAGQARSVKSSLYLMQVWFDLLVDSSVDFTLFLLFFFRSMTACGYEYSAPFNNRYFVGNPIDYKNVTMCMDKRDRDGYQLDGTCICTDHEGQQCGPSSSQFGLSNNSSFHLSLSVSLSMSLGLSPSLFLSLPLSRFFSQFFFILSIFLFLQCYWCNFS